MKKLSVVKAVPSAATEHACFSKDALVDSDQLQYLKETLGADAVIEIAKLFISEARNSMDDILDAFEEQSCERIASKSHSTKSSAATLGCMSLAETLMEIETTAKRGLSSELSPMIIHLQALLDVSLSTLLQRLETI